MAQFGSIDPLPKVLPLKKLKNSAPSTESRSVSAADSSSSSEKSTEKVLRKLSLGFQCALNRPPVILSSPSSVPSLRITVPSRSRLNTLPLIPNVSVIGIFNVKFCSKRPSSPATARTRPSKSSVTGAVMTLMAPPTELRPNTVP